MNKWGFLQLGLQNAFLSAVGVAVCQTLVTILLGQIDLGVIYVLRSFSNNVFINALIFTGVTALSLCRPERGGVFLLAGVTLLVYSSLIYPFNRKFLPYVFTFPSIAGNGLLLAVCIAAGIGVHRLLVAVRAARYRTWRWLRVAAGAAVAASTVMVFQQPLCVYVSQTMQQRPSANVSFVLITVDALRADAVGEDTPRIREFAARSTTYENFYTASTFTPTAMMSLLTSTSPFVHGCDGKRAAPRCLPTLAEVLNARGYYTAAYVNNPNLSPELGFGRGFDVYRCYAPGMSPLLFGTPWREIVAFVALHLPASKNGNPQDEEMVRDVVREIKRLPGKAPFFLWVHILDPHAPLTPRQGLVPAAVYASADARRFRDGLWDKVELYPYGPRRVIKNFYRGEVRGVDRKLGELFSAMEAAGLLSYTTVIVTADHGEELFDHGWYGHGHQVYDETARIPFFIFVPDRRPGRCLARFWSLDIAPTILNIAGFKKPVTFEGIDLLGRENVVGDRPFVTVGEREGFYPRALRREGYALIVNSARSPATLYLSAGRPGVPPAAALRAAMERELTTFVFAGMERGQRFSDSPAKVVRPASRVALRALGYAQ